MASVARLSQKGLIDRRLIAHRGVSIRLNFNWEWATAFLITWLAAGSVGVRLETLVGALAAVVSQCRQTHPIFASSLLGELAVVAPSAKNHALAAFGAKNVLCHV